MDGGLVNWNFHVYLFSAGIGRTGVLITMETAMCLVEANQPIYPLDSVREMRDQRAMLIQTAVSRHFSFLVNDVDYCELPNFCKSIFL
jgi:protein tyrosine phosphatase